MTTAPAIVIDDGATECSLHRDISGSWVHVASQSFGATTIAIRTAPALEGPWSDPLDVFTPPESSAPNAFVTSSWVAALPALGFGSGSGRARAVGIYDAGGALHGG